MENYELYGYNNIVEAGDDYYLTQGRVDDPLFMIRDVNDVLECERDVVQAEIEKKTE